MSIEDAVREIDEAIAAGQPSWPRGSADLYAHIVRGIRKKREAKPLAAADARCGEGQE